MQYTTSLSAIVIVGAQYKIHNFDPNYLVQWQKRVIFLSIRLYRPKLWQSDPIQDSFIEQKAREIFKICFFKRHCRIGMLVRYHEHISAVCGISVGMLRRSRNLDVLAFLFYFNIRLNENIIFSFKIYIGQHALTSDTLPKIRHFQIKTFAGEK